MSRSRTLACVAWVVGVALAGLVAPGGAHAQEKVRVVTTLPVFAELVKAVDRRSGRGRAAAVPVGT